ncbi:DNA/RNA non-specific endonuclease [Lysinibacillus sphaericus]|nr:DNA/RNA non-specific endonuclease [Lysinibacillus sphaericus]
MLQSQQDEFSLAGVDRRYIEDTGIVGRNTTTPSPKPSNTQPSQNGSNKKPTEDKGTGKDPIKVKYGDHYTKDRRRKVLKENVEYTTKEGHTYKTDSKGRISSCEGNLELGKGKRNNHAQKVAGREDRLPDDEGGHLIASIFKGSGSLDNLVPMNGNLNKGEWKKLENMWAKQLEKGKTVEVKIKPIYKGDSQRPVSFDIEYKIGKGDWQLKEFENKPGGK